MIYIALWILIVFVVALAWSTYTLHEQLCRAEEREAALRRREAELAASTAQAFAARRALELRVRSLLPPPLAAAILAGGDVRISVTRIDSPGELRRVLDRVADVVPIRRNDPTKN